MVCRSRKTKRNNSNKRMTGGQETAGATPLPPQWFNPKQPFGFEKSNMKTAYGEANPVSAPCGNLAAFPRSSGIQTGGQETAGATFLPPQWFNPKQPFGFEKSSMKTAYGEANPVSAPCRNLAAFPKSSGIQTGGLKKKVKSKKTKKRSTSKKSVKKTKSKKSVKKSKSKKSVKKSKSKKTKRGGSKNNIKNPYKKIPYKKIPYKKNSYNEIFSKIKEYENPSTTPNGRNPNGRNLKSPKYN